MKRYNIIQIVYPTTGAFKNRDVDAIKFIDRGYAEVENNQDHDNVWHLCNWCSWADSKPANLNSGIAGANSDILVWEEGTNKYWVAEPFDWQMFESLEEAKAYMMSDKEYRAWPIR